MNVYLLYSNKMFDPQQPVPIQSETLIKDLELNTIFKSMAGNDEFILKNVKTLILSGLSDISEIEYRQMILKDCLKYPKETRELYLLACQGVDIEKNKYMGFLINYPSNVLNGSIKALELYIPILQKLYNLADWALAHYTSTGFKRFFQMIKEELSDSYIKLMKEHLKNLKFTNGILISANLSKNLRAETYTIHRFPIKKSTLKERIFGEKEPSFSFTISDKDEIGFNILSEIKDEGVRTISNIVAQSCDHIRSFFLQLKTELSFYIGCINLYEQIKNIGSYVNFPTPHPINTQQFFCQNLYNISLSLSLGKKIVGNTIDACGKQLTIVTGANQGGKTTFLQSVGQAYLMMQCGMFVACEVFSASIAPVFTHFKREEDKSMKSGKLDEELNRMSSIIDSIKPGSLLLMNESFASTNEREGSEIGIQIVSALIEKNINIIFVTHFYKFAKFFYDQSKNNYLFLRAEKPIDGKYSFILKEGKPLTTSFGEEIYNRTWNKQY